MSIPLGLEKWAEQAPEAVALAAPERPSLPYSGLLNQMRVASEAFRQAGVRDRSVVALALPNGPEFVTAALAITIRSACTPLDLSLTRDECRAYLRRLGASALICGASGNAPVMDAARELGILLISVRSASDAPAGVFDLQETERPTEAFEGRQTDAAFLLYTSATTDRPKLVPRTHGSMRVAAAQDAQALQLSAADRYLSLMPLCYSHGRSAVFTQLACGGSVFCPPGFDADRFLGWLEEFRPTWFSADPTLQRTILMLAREAPEHFRRVPLRFIRSAAAPPGPDLHRSLEELWGVPVLDGYGMTEVLSATRNTLTQRKPGSVGRSSGTDVAIMDESGNLLAPEKEGEVVLRGPTVMSGYLDDPEANLAAFHNGWFRTGDIGRLDRDGFLFIVGRRKEMINRGGKKVLPQEVDHVLASHPAIAEAAAFAIPHRTLGEDVAAIAVLRGGAQVSELELRRFAAQRLAPYKVPRRVVFSDGIPRTPTGKPKRHLLAGQYRDLMEKESRVSIGKLEQGRPPTAIEGKLIDIWRTVLGIEQITLADGFFELGGDSLSTAIMLAQAAEAFAISRPQLAEEDFFDQPTIATLAEKVSKCLEAPEESALPDRIVVLRKEGSRIPFFCFSTSDIEPYQFRHVSRKLGPEQPFIAVCPPPPVQENRLLKIEELARQSVAAIRSVREHGPYIVGAYCQSAALAFETALQLMDAGEKIALLALFEARAPGYPKIVRHWRGYVDQLSRIFRRGGAGITIRDTAVHIREAAMIATRGIRARTRRAAGSVTVKNPREQVRWNRVVRREYVLRNFPAPIVNFLAADVPTSTRVLDDPRFGWQDFAECGFEVRWFPCGHLTIFGEANVAALAAELEKVFQAAKEALGMSSSGADSTPVCVTAKAP